MCGIVNRERDSIVDKGIWLRCGPPCSIGEPGDEGLYLDGNLGFRSRILRMFDLKSGHQPMCNEYSSVWIVFNARFLIIVN